jgi:hypothetical protein
MGSGQKELTGSGKLMICGHHNALGYPSFIEFPLEIKSVIGVENTEVMFSHHRRSGKCSTGSSQ